MNPDDFRLLTAETDLHTYQWHTMTAKDFLCKHCGTLMFRRPRTDPNAITINVRCIDQIDLDSLPVKKLNCKKLP